MTQAKKLYVLLCGYEILPKTVSTKNRGGRFIMAEPICAYLIETSQGFVLFDTASTPTTSKTRSAAASTSFAMAGFRRPSCSPSTSSSINSNGSE